MNNKITVLIPCYNEEEVLYAFYEKILKIIYTLSQYDFDILYIDDGSKDNTLKVLKDLKAIDKRNKYVSLSRNFGKEIALVAGIDQFNGDALIIMDADLQDPPGLIPIMLEKWKEGYDDVYGKRISRNGETWLKKITSKYFYKLLAKMTRIEIQMDTGDFRLLSKRTCDYLKEFRESERYTKGLFSLVGLKKVPVEYNRDPRFAGTTKWNYFKLTNLAIEGITSFTTAPLKISTLIGFLFAIIAFIYLLVIIFKTILFGEPVRGYPSLISIVLFLGGIQLMSIGILGEYLGRVFKESKRRPLYFIGEMSTED